MAVALKLSERDLQSAVVECAAWLGWATYHTYDSRRSNAGFPDLVLVRERVIYAELKATAGKLSPSQREWASRLLLAGQEWYEWRPESWYSGEIEDVLRGRRADERGR